MWARRLVVAAQLLLLAGILIFPPPADAAGLMVLHHIHKPPPSSLDLAAPLDRPLSAGPRPGAATAPRRVLASADPTAYHARSLKRASGNPTEARAASAQLSVGPGFPGLGDHGYYPADVQVAVGASDVVEMTNTLVAVYTRNGFRLNTFQMSRILSANNSDEMSDPQVAWDPTTQRWIAAGMDLTTSETDIAVSDGTDPSGGWEAYNWTYGSSACPDQPRLGFSTQVIVVATELFSSDCHRVESASSAGATVLVADKAAMAAGASPAATQYGPDPSYSNFVPVQELAPAQSELAASTDWGTSASVHIYAIQGIPPNDTLRVQNSLLIHPLQNPGLNASERGGGLINAGDDRINDSTLANGILYLVADDRCTYDNDPYLETCARVMEISTSESQPMLLGENDIGWPSDDAYYAAIRPDSHGNALIVFGYSGPHDWPSVAATAALGPIEGEQGGTFTDAVNLAAGTSATGERWGDYSGAAIDPTNPDIIWTSGQVADNFGDSSQNARHRWGTHIDAISVADQLRALPNEVYPGGLYRGRTGQHESIQIRPSGGAHIANVRVVVKMPCRRGGYDKVTFQLPGETHQEVSHSGWFQAFAREGADRFARGYAFSINGRFHDGYSVTGVLRGSERDRTYGMCASGPVRYSAHI